MKKTFGKILAVAMAAVMTFTTAPALTAEAATKTVAAKTYYLQSEYSSEYFSISADKATKISNIKSSNKTVVKPNGYGLSKYYSVDEDGKDKSYSNYGYASFTAVKPGKATVSFKAGSTTYKQNITVKGYTNPLKSLKINNNELVSMIKNSAYGASTSAAKTIKVNATAASGWKIDRIVIDNYLDDGSVDMERYYNKVVSKGTLSLSGYNTKKSGNVRIYLTNKKDGGDLDISVSLRSATN